MPDETSTSYNLTAHNLEKMAELLKDIIEVQGQHTIMLKQMLFAATKPINERSPLALALEAMVISMNGQATATTALRDTMQMLPGQISAGMKREVDRAMTEF
jgi:hypothetical protein